MKQRLTEGPPIIIFLRIPGDTHCAVAVGYSEQHGKPGRCSLTIFLLSSVLTREAFAAFLQERGITAFYIAGADAAACIKSTCFNLAKGGYTVHVLSDCITSYDKKKLPELLAYYESRGCSVMTLRDAMQA